jgi:nitroreductase
MELIELTNLIKSRRSIRVWQDKEVPEKSLVQAIELATWAPNGVNRQNWYFYVILKKDTIKAIADAVAAGANTMMSWLEASQLGASPPPGVSRPPVRPNALAKAPALIAVSTRRVENPMEKVLIAREKVDAKASLMRQTNTITDVRIQSVSAAIAYLLLILHQMGLGAVWMVNPVSQAKEEIEKILQVPAETDIIALIPVGYPAETPVKTRKPVNEVCQVIK